MEVLGNVNTAFVLSWSYLFIQGTTIFIKNQGVKGGAISLYSESAIFLSDMTYLHFKSNNAIVGGALYVQVQGPIFPDGFPPNEIFINATFSSTKHQRKHLEVRSCLKITML